MLQLTVYNSFCYTYYTYSFHTIIFSLMMGQYGPKYVGFSGSYNIVNLIKLCAFVGLNYGN